MKNFQKDGQTIELKPIGENGMHGQVVTVDIGVLKSTNTPAELALGHLTRDTMFVIEDIAMEMYNVECRKFTDGVKEDYFLDIPVHYYVLKSTNLNDCTRIKVVYKVEMRNHQLQSGFYQANREGESDLELRKRHSAEQSRLRTWEASYIYDAQAYMEFNEAHEAELMRRKNAKIDRLSEDKKMLIGILTNQGIRIVTEEQAKELGLK